MRLFGGTFGDCHTELVSLKLKEGATLYHGRPYPVPHIHLEALKKEIKRLCEIGVLKKQPGSPWAAPTFIIPKKQKTVRVVTNFGEVNKRIVRTPYPIPKKTLSYKRWMASPMLPLWTSTWGIIPSD